MTRIIGIGSVILLSVSCAQLELKPVPFKPIGDVKQTMQMVLDPAADLIWDSAGSIITAEGVEELAPTTDEGWLAVQHSAAVVAETGNLLLMPGRAKDEQDWREISQALTGAGLTVLRAAKAKDADALFDAGGELYNVCVSCHRQYWPDENELEPLPR
jgi:hypothetical protein